MFSCELYREGMMTVAPGQECFQQGRAPLHRSIVDPSVSRSLRSPGSGFVPWMYNKWPVAPRLLYSYCRD